MYTKGSWRFMSSDHYLNSFAGIEADGKCIMEYGDCGSHEMIIDNPDDVKLMEASPNLLEACKEALELYNAMNVIKESEIYVKLKHAIKKNKRPQRKPYRLTHILLGY